MGKYANDTPLPMTRLELPLRGDVDNYRDELKNQKPQDLTFLGVINQHIGLWFFSKFYKNKVLRKFDFLTDVELCNLTRDSLRYDFAKEIVGRFTTSNLIANHSNGNKLTDARIRVRIFLFYIVVTHRYACIRHMENDKTLSKKVNTVLLAQNTEVEVIAPTTTTETIATSTTATTDNNNNNNNNNNTKIVILQESC